MDCCDGPKAIWHLVNWLRICPHGCGARGRTTSGEYWMAIQPPTPTYGLRTRCSKLEPHGKNHATRRQEQLWRNASQPKKRLRFQHSEQCFSPGQRAFTMATSIA